MKSGSELRFSCQFADDRSRLSPTSIDCQPINHQLPALLGRILIVKDRLDKPLQAATQIGLKIISVNLGERISDAEFGEVVPLLIRTRTVVYNVRAAGLRPRYNEIEEEFSLDIDKRCDLVCFFRNTTRPEPCNPAT